jgi:cytochrome c-type biogenesis protein CcmH/NrfF
VSVLWVLPLLVFAVGAVLALNATRQAAEAGARLREETGRLEELRAQLVALRTESDTTRATLEGLRRSDSRTTRG